MKNETFEKRLAALKALINDLPIHKQKALLLLVNETRSRHAQIQQSVKQATDALDEWRITLKYALFDREARTRELRDT